MQAADQLRYEQELRFGLVRCVCLLWFGVSCEGRQSSKKKKTECAAGQQSRKQHTPKTPFLTAILKEKTKRVFQWQEKTTKLKKRTPGGTTVFTRWRKGTTVFANLTRESATKNRTGFTRRRESLTVFTRWRESSALFTRLHVIENGFYNGTRIYKKKYEKSRKYQYFYNVAWKNNIFLPGGATFQ